MNAAETYPSQGLRHNRPGGESARCESVVRVHGADVALFRQPALAQAGGDSRGQSSLLLVCAHGWGQTHQALLPIAAAVRRAGRSMLLDLPGFGASPAPPAAWSTADYADALAEWLASEPAERRVWFGHSFGCRVGLQLAARHPDLVDGLFLVAAPGLPKRRSPAERARLRARRWSYRLARRFTPEGPARERLRNRFGSPDYRAAGPLLRPILVKAAGEDLGEAARAVRCPAMLIYGDRDGETPPEIGERLHRLMPQSQLVVLRGFGHLDIVTEGRHQIVHLLNEFLEKLA
jgi:pimeloyl-ACP methyl ester carboxylesterase